MYGCTTRAPAYADVLFADVLLAVVDVVVVVAISVVVLGSLFCLVATKFFLLFFGFLVFVNYEIIILQCSNFYCNTTAVLGRDCIYSKVHELDWLVGT